MQLHLDLSHLAYSSEGVTAAVRITEALNQYFRDVRDRAIPDGSLPEAGQLISNTSRYVDPITGNSIG